MIRTLTRCLPLSLALLWSAAAPAQDAAPVLQCMRQTVPAALRVQAMSLSVHDAAGKTRELSGRLYTQREPTLEGRYVVRAMLQLDAPEYVRGAAYLVREHDAVNRDGLYVYLPSVGRVRRVSGSFADGALLGTQFSYNDFKELQNAFGGAQARRLEDGSLHERPVYRLELRRLTEAGEPYSRAEVWVDRETCLTVKADFFEGEQRRRVLTTPAGSLRAFPQGGWYLSQVQMEDLASGSRTVLRARPLEAPAGGLQPFDPERFHQTKP